MGHIQTNALTYGFCNASKRSVDCGIDHKPEVRQGKMTYSVLHMYQFISVQAWTWVLLLIFYTEPCVLLHVKYTV